MAGTYQRVLLKLSGEALMGSKSFGIDNEMLQHYGEEIKSIQRMGVEVAIVIGGGNIYRGVNNEDSVIERVQGDYMGMLARSEERRVGKECGSRWETEASKQE